MKQAIVTSILALFALTSTAQDKAEGGPGWLWEVSGNGLRQKSYLFGTCHGDGHQFTTAEMFSIGGLE